MQPSPRPGDQSPQTTAALLQSAVQALRHEDLAAAQAALTPVLATEPEQIDALHLQGIVHHRQGDTQSALTLMRRALALQPAHSGLRLNLGNVLYESGQTLAAVDAYRALIEIEPGSAQAWSNLGTALHSLGDLAQARHAWQQAVHFDDGDAEAWYGLSRTLIELGQVYEGLLANSRAVTLQPGQVQAREQVIRALVMLGQRDGAAQLYRDWLTEDPDNAVAQHQLAATLGTDAPARASDAYLLAVFDSVAPQFDRKLAALGYQAPQQVAQAVAALQPAPGALDVADLGCGTGLCGPALRPWARRLVGCDLSAAMLAQAKRRGCYDQLFQVELAYFLQHEAGAFDLLVSADTLCYFGPLDAVCTAAAAALRSGGAFVFTVEALQDDRAPFCLQTSGRYAHSDAYLLATLLAEGLAVAACDAVTLRHEAGLPVAGWLVTARRG